MFLKIIINFDCGFSKKFIRFFQKIYTVGLKNLYGFLVFYKFFSKNSIKFFLKIIINFYNGFIKKCIQFFSIL